MAYFRQNEPYPEEGIPAEGDYPPEGETEEEYDDGFDELTEEEEPELTEAEKKEQKESRARLAMGAGNIVAVIVGTVLIMLLLTMLFSMIYFVTTDMTRNFSLFQTQL